MGELNRLSSGVRHAGSTSSLSSAASTSPPASPRDQQQQANGGSPGLSSGNGSRGGAAVPSSEAPVLKGSGGPGGLRHVSSMSTLYTEGEHYPAR
jgi:hypothetical protein